MRLPDELYWKPSVPSYWQGLGLWLTLSGDALPESPLVGQQYGFNLGTHVGDDLTQVQIRRHALTDLVGAPIVWLNQVHGCAVMLVDNTVSATDAPPEADASMSTCSSRALAIMTADCLPAVFVALDESRKPMAVAAAHAGWRGLHAGVLQQSVGALRRGLANRCASIECFLGPAIGPSSFEVGQDVHKAFTEQDSHAAVHFTPVSKSPDKYLADLYGLAKLALANSGVTEFHGGGFDTLTDCRWFSHRRAQQRGAPAGRFATVVRLLPP